MDFSFGTLPIRGDSFNEDPLPKQLTVTRKEWPISPSSSLNVEASDSDSMDLDEFDSGVDFESVNDSLYSLRFALEEHNMVDSAASCALEVDETPPNVAVSASTMAAEDEGLLDTRYFVHCMRRTKLTHSTMSGVCALCNRETDKITRHDYCSPHSYRCGNPRISPPFPVEAARAKHSDELCWPCHAFTHIIMDRLGGKTGRWNNMEKIRTDAVMSGFIQWATSREMTVLHGLMVSVNEQKQRKERISRLKAKKAAKRARMRAADEIAELMHFVALDQITLEESTDSSNLVDTSDKMTSASRNSEKAGPSHEHLEHIIHGALMSLWEEWQGSNPPASGVSSLRDSIMNQPPGKSFRQKKFRDVVRLRVKQLDVETGKGKLDVTRVQRLDVLAVMDISPEWAAWKELICKVPPRRWGVHQDLLVRPSMEEGNNLNGDEMRD
jgi:hypothetical protein